MEESKPSDINKSVNKQATDATKLYAFLGLLLFLGEIILIIWTVIDESAPTAYGYSSPVKKWIFIYPAGILLYGVAINLYNRRKYSKK